MLKFFLYSIVGITIIISLCSCSLQQHNEDDGVPYINPANIGNIRIAILGQEKKSNVVLVNQSNKQYLSLQDFAKEQSRDEVPLSSLKYKSSELSFDTNTVVVIVEDIVMAKLLGLFEKYAFQNFAESCTPRHFSNPQWPERDAIFLEDNGQWSTLLRDEKLTNEARQETQKAQTYRILKSYILQAHATGYNPMQVLYNIDGQKMFQEKQRQLEQSPQNLQRK